MRVFAQRPGHLQRPFFAQRAGHPLCEAIQNALLKVERSKTCRQDKSALNPALNPQTAAYVRCDPAAEQNFAIEVEGSAPTFQFNFSKFSK